MQNYFFKKIKKKKKVKTTHSYLKISMVFSLNSLKYSKNFVIQILCSYHKSSSIHNNIYHLSFVQISIFFYLSQFLSQSINSNVLLGFNFLRISIFFLNIISGHLTSFKKNNNNTHNYLYIIFKHYNTKTNK